MWFGSRGGKVFEGCCAREKNESRGGRFLRAAQTHGGMAGAEDAMHAAVPPWFGGLERDIYYRRTNYIHEMSCGEVGSHLYSRMCCAGRCARSAAVSISVRAPVTGAGSGWEGLMGMLLTFSMPPPTQQYSKPRGTKEWASRRTELRLIL